MIDTSQVPNSTDGVRERRSIETGIALIIAEIAVCLLLWQQPYFQAEVFIFASSISICIFYLILLRFVLSYSRENEREWRPLSISVLLTGVNLAGIIFLFAVVYQWAGVGGENFTITTLPGCIYFSVITITTVGYGDLHPLTRSARVFAALEALSGYVTLGLLIAALSNMLRLRNHHANDSKVPKP